MKNWKMDRRRAIAAEMQSKEAELRRLFAAPERDDLAIGEVRLALKNLETEREMMGGYNGPIERTEPGELRNEPRYRRAASGPVALDDVRIDAGEEREARRTFFHYLRTGDELALREVRAYNDAAMAIGTDAAGGYGVPVGLVKEIKARRDESMLAVKLGCELVEGVGTTIDYAVDDESDVLFSAVAEAGPVLQDTPALNKVQLTYVKYGKHQKISWELERDEDVELERFIRGWLTRGWAATHNNLLVTEVLANATGALVFDADNAVAVGEIPELAGKVMPEYLDSPNVAWLMNPATVAHLRGKTGDPFQLGLPSTGARELWGYPLAQSSYMPTIDASAKTIVFGDWSYVAYRDGPLNVLRDPYSNAATGEITLWSYFSAVYRVTQAEAIAYGTHPTG